MKKWLMRQYWRIQQSQAIIGLGFWTATITLLVWPYVSWRFESNETILFIPMTYIGLPVSYTHLTLPTNREV